MENKKVVIRKMIITKAVGYIKERWNIVVPPSTLKSAAQSGRLVAKKNEFDFWIVKPGNIESWLKTTNRLPARRK